MKIVIFLWKNAGSPKRVVDFPLARDTFRNKNHGNRRGFRRTKSYNNGKPSEIVEDFACESKFLHVSFFFHHFLHFFIFFNFSIFSFLQFFHFLSFFHFSMFFLFSFFQFFHFLFFSFLFFFDFFRFFSFSFYSFVSTSPSPPPHLPHGPLPGPPN